MIFYYWIWKKQQQVFIKHTVPHIVLFFRVIWLGSYCWQWDAVVWLPTFWFFIPLGSQHPRTLKAPGSGTPWRFTLQHDPGAVKWNELYRKNPASFKKKPKTQRWAGSKICTINSEDNPWFVRSSCKLRHISKPARYRHFFPKENHVTEKIPSMLQSHNQ